MEEKLMAIAIAAVVLAVRASGVTWEAIAEQMVALARNMVAAET